MNDRFLDQWRSVQSGNYWRFDPDAPGIRWHVAQRGVGWYWYTADYTDLANPTGAHLSSEVGPFPSWMAAAADCETAHK